MTKAQKRWDPLKRRYIPIEQLDKNSYQYELRFLWHNRYRNNEDIK
jgi:hypothetical protein